MSKLLSRFGREQDGATAIEYALIAGFIGVAIVGAVTGVGTGLVSIFNNVANGF